MQIVCARMCKEEDDESKKAQGCAHERAVPEDHCCEPQDGHTVTLRSMEPRRAVRMLRLVHRAVCSFRTLVVVPGSPSQVPQTPRKSF